VPSEDKYLARITRMIDRGIGKRLTFTRKNTIEGEVLQHTPPAAGEMDAEQGVYIEPPKALPILASCEVLVVGAGPAGLSAWRPWLGTVTKALSNPKE